MLRYSLTLRRTALAIGGLLAMLIASASYAEEATTAQMLKAAASGPKQDRYTAIDDLGERHANAAQAVPELVKLLTDADPQVRWRTARTLGEYNAQAQSAVEGIRKLLTDSDPIVQYHAVVALGKLGDKSDATVEALVAAATHKDPRVARAAISAIRSLKPGPKRVAEILSKALRSNDQATTIHALEVLVEGGPAAVPFLQEALKNPETAYLACTAIERIGPDAAPAVPELTAILGKTKHSQMLIQTLLALASIGPGSQSAGPSIVPLLTSSSDKTVPVAAAYALGAIDAKGADDGLKAAEKSSDPFLQMMASWALAKTHPDDAVLTKAAVERLTQGLKSDDMAIRTAAAKSLYALHAPVEIVAPFMAALVKDPNPDVQANAIEAIAGLGEKVVPRVIVGLKNPELRDAAVRVIAKLGPKAADSVQPLMEAAMGADAKVRTEIQLALGAIGPAAAPATDMLVKSLASKDAGERESALYALRKIGPGAKAAIQPLMARMKADDSFDADAAAWALTRISPSDSQVASAVVPKLIKGLSNADEQNRLEAIEALQDIGATDKAAAELKRLAAEDGSAIVRSAAEAALKK